MPNGFKYGFGLYAPVSWQINLSGLKISGFLKFFESNCTDARLEKMIHPVGMKYPPISTGSNLFEC